MNALSVIYSQLWISLDCDAFFPLYMNVLKNVFCVQKTAREVRLVPALIDGCTFKDLQWSIFKLTMKHNAAKVMLEWNNVNLVTRLWLKVVASSILSLELNEYLKLAELATFQILGSVEDERS